MRPLFNGDKVKQGVRLILEGIGEDLDRPGLRDTPDRVVAMFRELTQSKTFDRTAFDNVEQYDQIIMVRDIPFYSLCEHHLLPFFGTAIVGYLPGKTYLGLSKLARAVDMFSRSLQVQERLTMQIANWLMNEAKAEGAGVIIRARHLCMEMRGVEKNGNDTVTSAMLGKFRDEPSARLEFMELCKLE